VRRPLGPAPDRPFVRHDRWNRDVGLHGCTRLRRSAGAALAAYATGYPVGATIGGALTALAIPRYWFSGPFVVAAIAMLSIGRSPARFR